MLPKRWERYQRRGNNFEKNQIVRKIFIPRELLEFSPVSPSQNLELARVTGNILFSKNLVAGAIYRVYAVRLRHDRDLRLWKARADVT
jgi:hypothetical protein